MNIDVLVKDMIRTMPLPKVTEKTPMAILFVGAPASGKTYFAKKIMEQLPFAYFSHEQIEVYLSPHRDFFHDDKQTFEFSAKVVIELIKQKYNVIYDYSIDGIADRSFLRDAVKQNGGQTMLVYMKCEDAEISRRIQNANIRIVEGTKKGFILNQDYYLFKKNKIQSPLGEDPFIVNSTDDFAIQRFISLAFSKLNNPEKFSDISP